MSEKSSLSLDQTQLTHSSVEHIPDIRAKGRSEDDHYYLEDVPISGVWIGLGIRSGFSLYFWVYVSDVIYRCTLLAVRRVMVFRPPGF